MRSINATDGYRPLTETSNPVLQCAMIDIKYHPKYHPNVSKPLTQGENMSDKAHNVEQHLQAVACIENKNIRAIKEALGKLEEDNQRNSATLIQLRNELAPVKSQAAELKAEASALTQEKLDLQKYVNQLEAQLNDEQVKAKSAETKLEEQIKRIQAEKTNEKSLLESMQQNFATKIAELMTLQKEQAHELEQAKLAKEALKAQLEQKNKELAEQTKNNHDLGLQLLEKDNRYNSFKSQAEKRIAELTEASHTVEQMRKMLSGLQTRYTNISAATPNDETQAFQFGYSTETKPSAPVQVQSAKDMEDSFEQWLNPSGARKEHLDYFIESA